MKIRISTLICLLAIFFTALPGVSPAAELDPDQAFMFQAQLLDNKSLELYWQIQPGYYLYKDNMKLLDANNKNIFPNDQLPAGQIFADEYLGDYVVYGDQLTIQVPWRDDFFDNSLILEYQGCKDDGYCYLPINKLIHVNPDNTLTIKNTTLNKFPEGSATDKLADKIANSNIAIIMGLFFVFGILLTFTPCVLPMIPLVINLIVGPTAISVRKALILSGSYVIGMAGSYAIAGVFVGIIGTTLQAWLQQPAIIIAFSVLLIILALAQFDLIKIKLPHFNVGLHKLGEKQTQGSIVGAFLLGIISALIVSPCITPPLIGALAYISQDGNPIIGGLTLFSLGLGMGVPLIFVAILSSRILPKAGPWMQAIKYITGLILIGLAIWLLLRIVPTSNQSNLPWRMVTTMQELDKAVHTNSISLVDFYADWCISCKKIDANVFADPEIAKTLKTFNLIRIDLTDLTDEKRQMLKTLEVYGPPAILFYTAEGQEMRSKRIAGEIDKKEMSQELRAFQNSP